jgi:hypothetical protein
MSLRRLEMLVSMWQAMAQLKQLVALWPFKVEQMSEGAAQQELTSLFQASSTTQRRKIIAKRMETRWTKTACLSKMRMKTALLDL